MTDVKEMAESIVQLVYEGETVSAEPMKFEIEEGSIGRYRMDDGAIVELKHDVRTVYRLCDRTKLDGSPVYVLVGNATLTTLKRPNESAEPQSS